VYFEDNLGTLLRRLSGHVYAVLDGAHFDNLPNRLRSTRLKYRPLYVDEIDLPAIDSGPHLVDCTSNFAIEQVRDVTAGAPSVVWWGWHSGGTVGLRSITRHLRRLNLMDVPGNAEAGSAPRYGRIHAPGSDEPVLFQHADPDVICAILPVLAPVQQVCLFGGSHAIVTDPQSGPPQLLRNPNPQALVPTGRLALSKDQYAALSDAYGAALRHRAVIEFGVGLTARQKVKSAEQIRSAIDRAESYGLATQEQVWEFIRFDQRYGAQFEMRPEACGVLAQLTNPELSPAERLFRVEQELQFLAQKG